MLPLYTVKGTGVAIGGEFKGETIILIIEVSHKAGEPLSHVIKHIESVP